MGRVSRIIRKRAAKIFTLFILIVFLIEIIGIPAAWACCGGTAPQGGTQSPPVGNPPPPGPGTGNTTTDTGEGTIIEVIFGPGCPGGADPVNLNSGNFDRSVLLFSFPSRGMATIIRGYYNSQETAEGIMGQGWSHTFDVWLARMSDDSRVVVWGGRERKKYTPNGTGGFNSQPGNFSTLTFNPGNGTYLLTTKHGIKYSFIPASPAKALLSSVVDRNGNTITLAYDTNGLLTTLTDTAGRIFTFNYLNGKLSSIQDPAGRTVSFIYNTNNLLSQITDPMSNSIQYAYNSQKKLYSVTDAKSQTFLTQTYDDMDFPRVVSQNYGGQIFNLTYDFNNSTATETKNGKNTTYHYDPQTGFQTEAVDPLNNTTLTAYDSAGNMISLTDPKNLVTNFSYDSKGNVTQISQPMNITSSFTYDPAFSNVLTATDPNSHTSTFTYDSNGNVLTSTNPLGKTTIFTYDAYGQLTSLTNARNFTTSFSYDGYGNLTSTTDALNNVWGFGYDNRGNQTSVTDPLNHAVTKTFNLNDQVLTVTDPMNHTASFNYDANKKLASVTDANARVTTYGYDILDKLINITDPMNQSATYTYNNDGLLSSITNQGGHTTTYSYDPAERLITVTDPLNRVTAFGYDANGNMTSKTDGNGTVQYSYDNINRLTMKSFPDQTSIQYSYDPGSRRTWMQDVDGRTASYTYDAANRLTSLSGYFPTINYSYDDVGNLTNFSDQGPGNSTAYSYDALNRLSSVTYNTTRVFNYGYDAASRLTSLVYPNGVTANCQYNNSNWLTLLSYVNGQTPLMSFGYTFDNIGNRLTKLHTSQQGQALWQYAYDPLYRLTTETYPDTHTVTFTYDANGNRLTRAENGNTLGYTYDSADQLLAYGPPGFPPFVEFSWNGNGNLTQKVDHQNNNATTTYAYDFENHLTLVTFPNTTTESYKYNGNGIRVRKTTSAGLQVDYLLSGADVWREESPPGGPPPTDYILAGAMAGSLGFHQPIGQGGTAVYHYTHADGQESVMALTDDAGTITDNYLYDAFGNSLLAVQQTYNPYQYTGQQVDPSTGLYYLRNRYYDAQAGRFITKDPIGFRGGLNLFVYVKNNPINLIDPRGLDTNGGGATIVINGPSATFGVGVVISKDQNGRGALQITVTSGPGTSTTGQSNITINATAVHSNSNIDPNSVNVTTTEATAGSATVVGPDFVGVSGSYTKGNNGDYSGSLGGAGGLPGVGTYNVTRTTVTIPLSGEGIKNAVENTTTYQNAERGFENTVNALSGWNWMNAIFNPDSVYK